MKKREDGVTVRVMQTTALALAIVFGAARCSGGGPAGESTTSTQASSGSETPATTEGNTASAAPSESSSAAPSGDTSGAECTTNDDCVRDACCHATACVPRARAPQCGSMVCTRECRAGSLDCGGSCACEAGHCAAHRAQ